LGRLARRLGKTSHSGVRIDDVLIRAIEAKAKVSGLPVQKVDIGDPGDFAGYQENLEGVARWLCDLTASGYPELNFRFTDDDRSQIVDLLNQVYAIIEHRKQEAHNARYARLN
jgi:hypothetical protein